MNTEIFGFTLRQMLLVVKENNLSGCYFFNWWMALWRCFVRSSV